MIFDADINLINSLRLLNLYVHLSTRCSWNQTAACYYTFIIININLVLYYMNTDCPDYALMVTICFWNFTILTPFSIIIENLKSFKCYPWYSLIKRLLRSFQGLIMVKKQWKFSNRINVYRLWEWMSISAWQFCLLL